MYQRILDFKCVLLEIHNGKGINKVRVLSVHRVEGLKLWQLTLKVLNS